MYLFYQGKFLLNKKNIWFFSSICFQDFFCSESLQIIWNQSVEMLVEIHSLLTERCCCTWNRGEHQHFCQLSSFRRLEEVHKPRLNWFFKPLLILHGTNKERFVFAHLHCFCFLLQPTYQSLMDVSKKPLRRSLTCWFVQRGG